MQEIDTVQRAAAKSEVAKALYSGELVRPARCSKCGYAGHVDGHHRDYAKPLDVVWVCRSCHIKQHREEGTSGFKRPPIYGERMSLKLHVRLPAKVEKWVRRQAKRLGITPGQATRLAVKTVMDSGKDLELDKPGGVVKGGT